eukprot:TRINITY_DN1178_c0_g1_i2.p1 TRINITY_DN1178_c0_g1~~TRINITY_DN1178_c0_g1_i2.p1  ORF type:complete len:376 (-),score=41.51 TRINITY_DN1178_c0_g1_i2:115-1242(-)
MCIRDRYQRRVHGDQQQYGYAKERFTGLIGETFDCSICYNVVRDPKECHGCGSMFCSSCIEDWLKKRKECPTRCDLSKTKIERISKALMRIYNDLDIKCQYESCGKVVKLCDLEEHEKKCQLPKCINFDVCQNISKPEYSNMRVCDLSCLLHKNIKNVFGDGEKELQQIKDFMKQYMGQPIPAIGGNLPSSNLARASISNGITEFKWDTNNIGTGIIVSQDKKHVFLKETLYMFRTVIGDLGFAQPGVYYWEIIADSQTENELKIGVTTRRDFNFNSAFCDYEHGFAYYGLGQLRHNSNASGPQYGKKFKKNGVLGVCLDMNKGTLSFALDNEYFGVAYSSESLKVGPIYPAISLLHCAGCTLRTGTAVPQYFTR